MGNIIARLRRRAEGDSRGAVELVDVVLSFIMLVATIVLAPVIYRFIAMVSSEADPFTALLLQLFVPLLFIVLMVSVAVSARRGR